MPNKEPLSNQGDFAAPKIPVETVSSANSSRILFSSYDEYLAELQENYDDLAQIQESIDCCKYGHTIKPKAPNLAYEYATAFSSHPADEQYNLAPPPPAISVHAICVNGKLKIVPTIPKNVTIPRATAKKFQHKEGA